jgi:aldose 1-epimerase
VLRIDCIASEFNFVHKDAVFLEFHETLGNFLNPADKNTENDTLLTSDELYHNYVKLEVRFKKGSN